MNNSNNYDYNYERRSSGSRGHGGAHLAPRQSSAAKRRQPAGKKRKSGGGKKAAVVLVILALLLVGAFVGLGFVAKASTAVYPHVQVAGVELGGMSLEEAAAALQGAGLDNYSDKTVSVELSNTLTLDVNSNDAGVRMELDKVAQEAYDYGRGGGFFSNTVKYIGCLFSTRELPLGESFSINEDYVRGLISQAAVRMLAGNNGAYTLGDTQLTLIKSAKGLMIDQEEIYGLIYKAFANQDYSPIVYEPQGGESDKLDMQKLCDTITREKADAYYDKESGEVVPSVTGITFDVRKAQAAYDAASAGDTVKIDLIVDEPEMTTEEYEALLFRDLLAQKTTNLTGDTGRSKNVQLAAEAVNETVLMPGEIFDYNPAVGKRTTDRGFTYAPAYMGKETVQEVGGGICQVSSTIYYATLYARLETVARLSHQFAPSYVPLGMDATVSWGGPEFKFKNSSDYPIKIVAYINWSGDYRKSVTVELYGTKWDDRYVEMSYTYTGSVPFTTEYIDDPDLPEGEEVVETQGYVGTRVDTYRSVYEADGTLAYTEFIASSSYYGKDAVVRRGTGENVSPEPSEDPSPSPSESIEPTPSEPVSPAPEGEV